VTARSNQHPQRTSLAARAAAATTILLAGAGVCDAFAHAAVGVAPVLDSAALGCALSALVVLAACLVVLSVGSAARSVGDLRRLVTAWRGRNR